MPRIGLACPPDAWFSASAKCATFSDFGSLPQSHACVEDRTMAKEPSVKPVAANGSFLLGVDSADHVAAQLTPKEPSLLERRKFQINPPRIAIQKEKLKFAADLWQGEFKVIGRLGSGSSSKVQRAIRLFDNKEVALKNMYSTEQQMVHAAHAELRAIQRMSHPHIIKALDLQIRAGQAVLVMDYFDGAPLDKLVHARRAHCSETMCRRYAIQLFSAISHVHDKGMIHRDIKPANVLLSLNAMTLMLIDFNTSTDWVQDDPPLTPAGTTLYMAPEELQSWPSTPASDIWCAALCVFLMLSGRLPQRRCRNDIPDETLREAVTKPIVMDGEEWVNKSHACKRFLGQCLAIETCKRPSAKLALESKWLTQHAENCSATRTQLACDEPVEHDADHQAPQHKEFDGGGLVGGDIDRSRDTYTPSDRCSTEYADQSGDSDVPAKRFTADDDTDESPVAISLA